MSRWSPATNRNQSSDAGGNRFRIRKGLDLPIAGPPDLSSIEEKSVGHVALVGADYVGLKPTMEVQVGDPVRKGQLLFTDKKNPGVRYTSPGSGRVTAIHRGKRRVLESLVIELDGEEEETFPSYEESEIPGLSSEKVRENLLASGLWTSLRTRPYSKVPPPDSRPHSIFVNAMDSNPLAAPPRIALKGREKDFQNGLTVLSKLTDGKLYLCHHPGDEGLPGADLEFVTTASFEGPHPSGLVGTHIHFLDPVSRKKTVWHVNLQDTIAIGALFTTGKLDVTRLISLAGPMVRRPRLLRTRIGAYVPDLVEEADLKNFSDDGVRRRNRGHDHDEIRLVAGSVLSGYEVDGSFSYLGRYHLQICAIEEDPKRKLLEWHYPGIDRFSVTRLFLSRVLFIKKFHFTTCTNGSARAMVPVGSYEAVMPLDMLPTFLLRSLIVGDTDQAQALGCLELDEEDLALCTFACPAKYDFGPILRHNLSTIESDG